MEMEKENNINFLDISILKNNESFEFKIYRRPTTTDTIIPSDCNHPPEHKLPAIRYLINRLHSYPKQAHIDKQNMTQFGTFYIQINIASLY